MPVRRRAVACVAPLMVTALMAAAPPVFAAGAEDTYSGSQMWLHYVPVADPALLGQYRAAVTTIVVDNADQSPVYRHTTDLHMEAGAAEKLEATTLDVARDELVRGLGALLDQTVPVQTSSADGIPNGAVIVGTPDSSPAVKQYIPATDLAAVGNEGYLVRSVSSGSNTFTVIAGNTDIGALYGTFDFLRLIQTEKPVTNLNVASSPKVKSRHLDNWETTRLYAGNNAAGTGGLNGENGTIFDFAATGAGAAKNLPVILDRYIVMARALASIGINGIEINLVNADNVYLTTAYIAKEAAEQGGIIAYANDNNYMKLAWEMGSSTAPINKLRVVVIREQNGTATTTQVQGNDAQSIVGADGAIWFRIAKSGSSYKTYYSTNGSVWKYAGTTTLNVEATQAGLVAFNRAGTSTDLKVAFDYFHITSQGDPVPSAFTEAGGTVGGTVPATLALTLGAPASFGAFTPGIGKDYAASMTAGVTSTAADAALTVADPSAVSTGRLVNGAFSLAQPLQAQASSAAGTGSAFAAVGGTASPTALLSYAGPVSNDTVTIGFKQTIGSTEGLRTGAYGKTLTFTLSTTNP